jgi:ABC-2 type transport system permease protein
MKNVWNIAMRDFKSYFFSPIAYIVIASFLLIIGYMFVMNLEYFAQMQMQYQQFNAGRNMGLSEGVVRPLYGNMNVILLFLSPFITMRLFAEERKLSTFALLATSPLTLTEIVLGKFFSGFFLILVMMAATSVYPILLLIAGNPDHGVVITCLIGSTLLAGCLVAVGVLFSAMTDNQIVAGSLTFASGLLFWLIAWAAQNAGPVWSDLLNYLSLINHFNEFSQGVLNTSAIIYYLSFMGVSLFLTHRVLDSYRWR